ncbi:MAG: polymer-forming cytoskeletal protein [Acidiferrobacterales bacterium]
MFGSQKEKRRTLDEQIKFTTSIGEGSVFEGVIRGTGHHSVSGKVIGDCDTVGVLKVEQTGFWLGNILADVVIISGMVEGNVMARTKIELYSAGRVAGNMEAPAIAIDEGAEFDGQVKMAKGNKVTRFKERRNNDSPETKD